ncbi:MAG: Lrp/AsnC family transcriptional regulator [archaeon]
MLEILDLVDRKIIYTLDFDARMPLSQLAKRIGISKQVAAYRIERLKKRGVIMGFYTDISGSKIGYEIFVIYFKFQRMSPDEQQRFIRHIGKAKNVGVNISINGQWDHCIVIWARDVVEFKLRYQEAMGDWERFIRSKDVMMETDFYYFKPTQILDKPSDRMLSMTGVIERPKLDRKDHLLLSGLASDCRMPLVELGKKAGLTANGAKQRIRRLEKEGIILGYRVFIDYQLLGFLHYRVFLHLESLTDKVERRIIQFLRQHRACPSITKTIGYCELEFRAICKDVNEFYAMMDDLRRVFPDEIKEYDSILYARMHEAWNYFPFEE